jgi:methyl-accepting chemotaxis protein
LARKHIYTHASTSEKYYVQEALVKVRRFRDWTIFSKILSMSLGGFVAMFLILVLYLLPVVEHKIMDMKKEGLKGVVESAVSLVAEYDDRVKAGEFSQEEGQRRAAQSVKNLRYGKSGYLWINDTYPKVIMHPTQPQLDGTDVTDYKDPNGKRLFVEFVKVCKEKGEGTVEYMWPRPGTTKPVPKASYVKIYEPWGWIIGTGDYVDDIVAEVSSVRWKVIGIFVITVLLAVSVATVVARKITIPLRRIADNVRLMADGDLSVHIDRRDAADEVGALAQDVRTMAHSLSSVIGGVTESSLSVHSTVEGVKSALEKTAGGVEEQAMRASQIATSAEEMSETIIAISKNAQIASSTSSAAMRIAEEGKEVADSAIAAVNSFRSSTMRLASMMENLNGKVGEIGNIVAVINDIADQTNLLALNAAIEAARAGDQGRGFAVVADEVKKLAERTMRATEEISEKVRAVQVESQQTAGSMEEATSQVSQATDCITQLEDSLQLIVDGVQKARDEITQMATAVDQQSSVSQEIARAIEGSSLVAQNIDRATREVLIQIGGLEGVAARLKASVSEFRT